MRRQRAGLWVGSGLICMAVAAVSVAAPPRSAGPPAGPPLAPRSHGFMLYVNQPVGGTGGASAGRPTFGLRLEQVRMTGNTGAPDAGDPMQRRTLIGWQMDGLRDMRASDMRVELGGRVIYDVRRAAFRAPVAKPLIAVGSRAPMLEARTGHIEQTNHSQVRIPQESSLPGLSRDTFGASRDSSSTLRDLADTALATFRSSRPNQPRTYPNRRPQPMRDGG